MFRRSLCVLSLCFLFAGTRSPGLAAFHPSGQADETTHHGAVVEAMDAAREAGFRKLGIATQAGP